MRELLEKWAAAEPTVCVLGIGGIYVAGSGPGSRVPLVAYPQTSHVLQHRVLSSAIEALEARDWGWMLKTRAGAGDYVAVVATNDGAFIDTQNDTPAAALLSAYLAALDHLAAVDEYGGTR